MKSRYISLIRTMMFTLLMTCISMSVMAETYPANCRARTNLNVRVAPSIHYSKRGLYLRNDHFIVNSITPNEGMNWGEVIYDGEIGYVSMDYVEYLSPYEVATVEKKNEVQANTNNTFKTFWGNVWSVIKTILIILAVLIVLAFWKHIIQGIIYLSFFTGAGALITYILFGNGGIGSVIGLVLGIILGLRYLANQYGFEFPATTRVFYNLISFPFYLLNKIEFFLVEPWRYIFKSNWMSDETKSVVRPILFVVKILLYIITTPLRILNAINYNIIIHVCIELYDLLYEVLSPSSYDEGKTNFGEWLLYFPVRVLKYPIWHGMIVVVEGVIWTIVDTFIPALTMYHGTDLTAARAITCSTDRNKALQSFSRWTDGAFMTGKCCWGGIGVYFASMRSVARGYAYDPNRLSDNDPVMIVCRVSLGDVINYSLAPDYVYNNTGYNKKANVLNKYAEDNGYTTGEWWNDRSGYWEFCMFDWKNRYNSLWRIRPIYIYNFRTGLFEHITGGMQHWLFEKDIIKGLFGS